MHGFFSRLWSDSRRAVQHRGDQKTSCNVFSVMLMTLLAAGGSAESVSEETAAQTQAAQEQVQPFFREYVSVNLQLLELLLLLQRMYRIMPWLLEIL